MKTVSLNQDNIWKCPNCDHVSKECPIIVEMTPDDWHKQAVFSGAIESWQETPEEFSTGGLVSIPDVVECSACGFEFESLGGDDK